MLKQLPGIAVIASALAIGQSAHAGIVANLYANPSSINEGQTTTLQLTLNYSAPANGTYYGQTAYQYSQSGFYHYATNSRYYYDGTGGIYDFSGTISSGDGQFASIGGTVNSSSANQSRSFTYNSPSTYTASVSGTANVGDNLDFYNTVWMRSVFGNDPFQQIYNFGPFQDGTYNHSLSFNASTQIFVNNLFPSITHLAWDTFAYVGDTVSFLANGFDPAGIGTTESMIFAYDLDNDGMYDDYSQAGSLSSSGATTFQTAGVHHVGVRLTDGRGGTAFASFDVNVMNLPPVPESPAVPEPTSLAIFGLSALGFGLVGYRRRKAAR